MLDCYLEPDTDHIIYEDKFYEWCIEQAEEFESFARHICADDDCIKPTCFAVAIAIADHRAYNNIKNAASEQEAVCWLLTEGFVQYDPKKENIIGLENLYEKRARSFFDDHLMKLEYSCL